MEVKGKQLDQLLGIVRGRERDEKLKESPQGPKIISKKFSEWMKQADQVKKELVEKGVEPKPIIITNIDPYETSDTEEDARRPWGEWPENRKHIENSKNLCYRLAEVGIIQGMEVGKRIPADLKNSKYKDNLTGAALAMISNEAYVKALSLIKEYSYPDKISKMMATKIMGQFLLNILEVAETSPELREQIVEFTVSIRGKMYDEIQTYFKSVDANEEDSQDLKSLDLKLDEIRKEVTPRNITGKPGVNGWLYYASVNRWPHDEVDQCIASHCPDFPIEGYFSRSDCCAGILLIGRPFKFFSTDMSTSSDELAMGEGWDIEKYIVDHMADIYQSAESDNIAVDQALEDMRAQNKYNCSSLSEAWATRTGISNVYTEIWMKNSKAYAIWIDKEWEDKILLFFDRYSLKKLLTQRSELPVLDTDGSLMDRQ